MNVLGVLMFAGPVVLLVYGVGSARWGLVALSILAFFVLRKLSHIIETQIGISSPSNPQQERGGPGITLVAPWLKPENREKQKNEK